LNEEEALFRAVIKKLFQKHGDELMRVAEGDPVLEAGIAKFREIAGVEG